MNHDVAGSAPTLARTPLLLPALSDVTVAGWMRESAVHALRGYVGGLPSLCEEVGGEVFAVGRLLPNAAGKNAERVTWWNGESEGNWLYAWLGHVALVGSNDERQSARRRVRRILDHQDDDGYLGMFDASSDGDGSFIPGDLWTQTCLIRALRLWADAERDESIHAAIDRAVWSTMARISTAIDRGTAFVGSQRSGHDLMFVDVLYDSHQRSPDPAFGECARRLFDAFSAAEIDHVFADFQRDRLLSDEPISGHGAHVAEHARVPLQIAAMIEDAHGEWMDLFTRGWEKIAPALGSSGGLKSDETVGSPGHPPVHLAESGEEHCALTELVDTALTAAALTDDHRWLERAEAIILNAAPAGVLPDGTAVAYLHAENQTMATREMGTRWDYSPTHDDAAVCCAPNAGRLLPVFARHMVGETPDGYRVQLYGPVTVGFRRGAGEVTVSQRTVFPFDERVDIRVVAPADRFTVELRIPSWCAEPSATLENARDAAVTRRGAYLVVEGEWAADSRIILHLPQTLHTSETADGRVGIALGPLSLADRIPHHATVTRTYPGSDLADLDISTADPRLRLAPVLRPESVAAATVHRAVGSAHTWADPGVAVHLPMIDPTPRNAATTGADDKTVELVPIGSTTLRWSIFTMIRSGRR